MSGTIKDEITEAVVCFVELAKNFEKAPRAYVDNELLYSSEIHIIDVIGRNQGEHLSEIARKFGVTKGAASQLIKKLEKKGYIFKKLDESNQTRMKVHLTEKGKIAFNEHLEFHHKHNGSFSEFLNKKNNSELNNIRDFLAELNKFYE